MASLAKEFAELKAEVAGLKAKPVCTTPDECNNDPGLTHTSRCKYIALPGDGAAAAVGGAAAAAVGGAGGGGGGGAKSPCTVKPCNKHRHYDHSKCAAPAADPAAVPARGRAAEVRERVAAVVVAALNAGATAKQAAAAARAVTPPPKRGRGS